MYIPPMLAGALILLVAEIVIAIIYGIWKGGKK